MGGVGRAAAVALLAAAFVLAFRMLPVRLEEEKVQAQAGSLGSRVVVVDGDSGGFGGADSQTAAFLIRWLAGSGAMVLLSGDLDPGLAAPGPGDDPKALAVLARDRSVPADLILSIRTGGAWSITYSAGQEELAQDVVRETALALGVGGPAVSAAAASGVPWVRITTPPLDVRGQHDLAWAVYAATVRYFAALPPPVDGKALETLERDIPATVDSR